MLCIPFARVVAVGASDADLAALMAVEQVPDIPMFRKNTGAFVHEMSSGSLSNVDDDATLNPDGTFPVATQLTFGTPTSPDGVNQPRQLGRVRVKG
jgi:hypothetical protein